MDSSTKKKLATSLSSLVIGLILIAGLLLIPNVPTQITCGILAVLVIAGGVDYNS